MKKNFNAAIAASLLITEVMDFYTVPQILLGTKMIAPSYGVVLRDALEQSKAWVVNALLTMEDRPQPSPPPVPPKDAIFVAIAALSTCSELSHAEIIALLDFTAPQGFSEKLNEYQQYPLPHLTCLLASCLLEFYCAHPRKLLEVFEPREMFPVFSLSLALCCLGQEEKALFFDQTVQHDIPTSKSLYAMWQSLNVKQQAVFRYLPSSVPQEVLKCISEYAYALEMRPLFTPRTTPTTNS